KVRGFFAGDDGEVFRQAAELSFQVNVSLLDKPLEKVVVYLDPEEYRSTWLGNKAIYRTRMALSDGGELIILAPGVKDFGEDAGIDALIRRYGYAGREEILSLTERQKDLKENLCAAAHLIHGSSDGRFRVTYAPGGLSRQEVEAAGFSYADLGAMMKLYNPDTLKNGWNSLPSGEEVFYISNPALGLWARRISFSGVMSRRTPT
ncbi:MAG: D-mannonate epimerase, partial [Spirochaetales bacterium]|nr:D-mannonate epimerase [Spirochaetales bacterium]